MFDTLILNYITEKLCLSGNVCAHFIYCYTSIFNICNEVHVRCMLLMMLHILMMMIMMMVTYT